jgi:hypothetical protein
VVAEAGLPPEFSSFAELAPGVSAAPLPSALIQSEQARWLSQWTAVVLQGQSPAAVR